MTARRRRAQWLGLLALLVAAAGGVAGYRHIVARAAYATFAAPPVPDLTGKPAVLRQRILAANKAVQSSANLSTVAELGRLYHENGFITEAERCWQWLHARQPGEPKWAYYLADTRRTAGDYEGDEALLNQTVAIAPDYAPAWLQLGQLQFKSGRLELAQRSFERRLKLVPGDAYARLGLARIAWQQDRHAEARQQLARLVQDAPQFPPSLNLYAEWLAQAGEEEAATQMRFRAAAAGRYREAEDPWIEELQAWCYDPKRLAVLGTIDSQTNHGDRGRGYLERAMELAPDNDEIARALSTLYLSLGDIAKAQALLDAKIPVIQPPDPMLYVNRCEVARLQHHPDEALKIVDRALAMMPEAFQLHNERGAILGDLGRLAESAAAYREAIARAPTDTDSNYSLGMTLLALGQKAEGIQYVKRSLTLQPSFPKALLALGRLALETGDLATAASYLKPLYELHQDQEMARQLMAQWYLRTGLAAMRQKDNAAAEENFRAGFAIDARNPPLAMNLGTLCLMEGKVQDSIAPLEAFHTARPEDPQSALFLGQAYAQTGRTDDARRILRDGESLARRKGDTATAGYCREILSQL